MILTPKQFYENRSIQQRMAEYCGGQAVDPESFTTEYLSGVNETLKYDKFSEEYFFSTDRTSFLWLLEQGVDLFRAVWDRTSTIGVLDTEYFNLLYPAEAYFNPNHAFHSIEPVYKRIRKIFRKFGITNIPIITGQGYHFSFKVDFSSQAHQQLISLGKLGETLSEKYRSPGGRRTRPVPAEAALAFEGMGRLLEYFAHLVLADLGKGYKGMPVVCTDLAVGKAREAVALDLSMYADPLYTRDMRCVFSTYQKHKVLQEKFGSKVANEIPVLVTLPRLKSISLDNLLKMRKDFLKSQRYAVKVETKIPESSEGISKLIKSYKSSRLYHFHRYFDSEQHEDPDTWHSNYDRFDPCVLPPCVAYCLQFPNDNILKPTNIQTLTRVLIKMGWHPRHIAGLIRSKLEKDFNWGNQWFRYDPSARANFYVRLFSGLIATGIDKEEDCNCFSHREKGYCLQKECSRNLADYIINSDYNPVHKLFPGFDDAKTANLEETEDLTFMKVS